MKKITTLLLATVAFVAAQAQTPRDDARRVVLKGGNGNTKGVPQSPRDVIINGGGTSTYPNDTRQAQIDQVNREYDAKIASIRNNPNLSQEEKDRAIRQLEKDRASRIRGIGGREGYEGSTKYKYKKNKKHDDDDDDDDDNNRKDNGRHLGWEKGKGNPHKNGGKQKDRD